MKTRHGMRMRESGWDGDFRRGVVLLKRNKERYVNSAYKAMDKAIGIRPPANKMAGSHLTTHTANVISTANGLKYLPVNIVRHVEYERMARALGMSESDINLIHSIDRVNLTGCSVSVELGKVTEVAGAIRYLLAAAEAGGRGNRFASSAIQWLSGGGTANARRTSRQCHLALVDAVITDNMIRAIFLGTMMYGTGGESGEDQAKSASASNIAWMLAEGAEGMPRNLKKAIHYYERAIDLNPLNMIAANNLGQILCTGDVDQGVYCNSSLAAMYFAKSIFAGDRDHAPRNLALIYSHGAPGIKQDIPEAVRLLVMQVMEGSEEARRRALASLDRVMMGRRFTMARHRDLSSVAKDLLSGKYLPMAEMDIWQASLDQRWERRSGRENDGRQLNDGGLPRKSRGIFEVCANVLSKLLRY
jgi:TPR repeat protein